MMFQEFVQKDGAPNRGQMCWVAVGKKNRALEDKIEDRFSEWGHF